MTILRRTRLDRPRNRFDTYLPEPELADLRVWSRLIGMAASSFICAIVRRFIQCAFTLAVCFSRANGDIVIFKKEIEKLPEAVRDDVKVWGPAVVSLIPMNIAPQFLDTIFGNEETLH